MNNFPLPQDAAIIGLYPSVSGIHFEGEGNVSLAISGKVSAGVSKDLGKFVVVLSEPLGAAFRLYGLEEVLAEDGKYSKDKQVLGKTSGTFHYDIIRLQEARRLRLPLSNQYEFSPRLFVNPASFHISLVGCEVTSA